MCCWIGHGVWESRAFGTYTCIMSYRYGNGTASYQDYEAQRQVWAGSENFRAVLCLDGFSSYEIE